MLKKKAMYVPSLSHPAGTALKNVAKGQLISKCLFGVFNFFQKNEQKQVDLRFHSSKVEFLFSFFGRNAGLKK